MKTWNSKMSQTYETHCASTYSQPKDAWILCKSSRNRNFQIAWFLYKSSRKWAERLEDGAAIYYDRTAGLTYVFWKREPATEVYILIEYVGNHVNKNFDSLRISTFVFTWFLVNSINIWNTLITKTESTNFDAIPIWIFKILVCLFKKN